MPHTLLHIDASPRTDERSHSRRLTARFAKSWKAAGEDRLLIHRDLRVHIPPHIDQPWIAAAFTTPHKRTPEMSETLLTSDALVDEFLAADEYLLGVPMYNFTVSSALKAWIDNIVRIGRTFAFHPEDPAGDFYKPLVPPGRRMTVVIATGDAGYEPGGPLWRLNQLEPYLRTLFTFVGVADLRFIYAGNDEFGGDRLERSLQQATREIDAALTSRAS